jgi:hypothetical protein
VARLGQPGHALAPRQGPLAETIWDTASWQRPQSVPAPVAATISWCESPFATAARRAWSDTAWQEQTIIEVSAPFAGAWSAPGEVKLIVTFNIKTAARSSLT